MLFVAFAMFCFLAGCSQQQQFKSVDQICIANADRQKAMQKAEYVLAKMYFTIEKADVEQGLIRTRPLAGAQFFEFWRNDSVGGLNAAEANLHSIRRIVELNISQQNNQLCIGCNAKTQRLSLSEQQIRSSAHAYNLFSKSSSSKQRLELDSRQKGWIDLGRDARLETEILKRIKKQIAKP